jgi:Calcineurin-like phosphoesterase
MPRTLWRLVSLLVKIAVLGGMTQWGLSTLPLVYAQTAASGGGFDFVVMGDLPYTTKDVDQDRHFERLIAAINKIQPTFSIHIGDIKSGSALCNDATFEKIKAYFLTFQKPLVYVPGDNEWTDCHRKSNGPFDPLERLAKIRGMFFPQAMSWGQQTLSVIRQSDVSAFPQMVENARWVTQNILFVTVHVVGSNNNLRQQREAALEFLERNQANMAWINEAFTIAKRDNVQAIVLAMHANPDWRGRHGDGSGFQDTIATLATNAADFGKPLLIVHGDTHTFTIDQPLRHPKDDKKILDNVVRLEVFGNPYIHAVRVLVNPQDPMLFAFQPLFIPENMESLKR